MTATEPDRRPRRRSDAPGALSADLRVLGRDYHGIERSDGHWNYADAGGRIDGLPMPAEADFVITGTIQHDGPESGDEIPTAQEKATAKVA